jgi:DNA-binding Lrp family transcriptional regulator
MPGRGIKMNRIKTESPEKLSKPQSEFRDTIERAQSRVNLLGEEDRVLMTMYLQKGNSFREIARIAGKSETTIARRIRRLGRRLIDDTYTLCLLNHSSFEPSELRIARDYFIRALPMTKIARAQNLSYYRVRKALTKIRRLVLTSKPRQDPPKTNHPKQVKEDTNADVQHLKELSVAGQGNR